MLYIERAPTNVLILEKRIPMEKNASADHHQPSSISWMLDKNNRPYQSQWLQITLAELDGKINKILEVVEDNGDTFAQRAEMYYQKRPELIKMVGDLHKSYRSLADKYDLMLRSESLGASNSFIRNCNNSGLIIESPDSISECHDHDQSCSSDEFTKQQKPEADDAHEDIKVKGKDVAAASSEKEGWDELLVEITKLIDESTSKQAELIKRYNKKRDDVKLLVHENRRLRDLLAQRKINFIKQTPSLTNSSSKWKTTLFGKLLIR